MGATARRSLCWDMAGSQVIKLCLHLGPAVDWAWRGRPCSGWWHLWSSLWRRVCGWDHLRSTLLASWAGTTLCMNSAMSSDPLHVGPGGSLPLGGCCPWYADPCLRLLAVRARSFSQTLDSCSARTKIMHTSLERFLLPRRFQNGSQANLASCHVTCQERYACQ